MLEIKINLLLFDIRKYRVEYADKILRIRFAKNKKSRI